MFRKCHIVKNLFHVQINISDFAEKQELNTKDKPLI
jgi:hypothetical protein